ncbi:MAG: hypothetical protein Q9170_001625 [Blastenia crenularia]
MASNREKHPNDILRELHAVFSAAIAGESLRSTDTASAVPPNDMQSLREQIQAQRCDFVTALQTRGHLREVTDTPSTGGQTIPEVTNLSTQYPRRCTQSDMLEHIRAVRQNKNGTSISFGFDGLLVRDLFFEQALPWTDIASEFIERCWTKTKAFIAFILSRLIPENTQMQAVIMSDSIGPLLNGVLAECKQKLEELCAPSIQGYPLLHDNRFPEDIHDWRIEFLKEKTIKRFLKPTATATSSGPSNTLASLGLAGVTVAQLATYMSSATMAEWDEYASLEMLHCMQKVYKVSNQGVKRKRSSSEPTAQQRPSSQPPKLASSFQLAKAIKQTAHSQVDSTNPLLTVQPVTEPVSGSLQPGNSPNTVIGDTCETFHSFAQLTPPRRTEQNLAKDTAPSSKIPDAATAQGHNLSHEVIQMLAGEARTNEEFGSLTTIIASGGASYEQRRAYLDHIIKAQRFVKDKEAVNHPTPEQQPILSQPPPPNSASGLQLQPCLGTTKTIKKIPTPGSIPPVGSGVGNNKSTSSSAVTGPCVSTTPSSLSSQGSHASNAGAFGLNRVNANNQSPKPSNNANAGGIFGQRPLKRQSSNSTPATSIINSTPKTPVSQASTNPNVSNNPNHAKDTSPVYQGPSPLLSGLGSTQSATNHPSTSGPVNGRGSPSRGRGSGRPHHK